MSCFLIQTLKNDFNQYFKGVVNFELTSGSSIYCQYAGPRGQFYLGIAFEWITLGTLTHSLAISKTPLLVVAIPINVSL